MPTAQDLNPRPRATDLGLHIGLLPHGPHNSITDVEGVAVGHTTLVEGDGPLKIGRGPVRTGVTVVLPHQKNIFRQKVTAAVHVVNGFGKPVGFAQIEELGVIESPIALTSTLNTWRVADALVDYLSRSNSGIFSFNPVVGECNDSFLNDMMGRHVKPNHVFEAIVSASTPNIQEGNVGAGAGMTGFGWKGGIGTSSRVCDGPQGAFTIGALVLTNTGDPRELRIDGVQVGRHILPPGVSDDASGSIMMIIGTDAPVTSRQLGRIGRRAAMGLGRVGGIASHGSGDFVIAFSNSSERPGIDDAHLTPLFRGVVEATEEAIINSILRAETTVGRDGNTRHAIPVNELGNILAKAR
ncbi:MAG: P1 family peptidase [Chloroflexi bacterium]|nr:P1 family peptidase [Chloroflexota bacterium]